MMSVKSKNIYVLSTDKPSRLFNCFGKLGIGDYITTRENLQVTNQNIYITSDEEIKEGDWFLDDNNSLKRSYKLSHVKFANPKKTILTTDQDLIKDGVQAIDDEFLEWFVNNPNCEEVETEIVEYGFDEVPICIYKTIIPKEESKQEKMSKDEIIETLEKGISILIKRQERMYSEEDMLRFAQKYAVNTLDKSHIKEFKKK